jgi:hypothetical protein
MAAFARCVRIPAQRATAAKACGTSTAAEARGRRGGHLSAALCHMANISYRLGKRQSVQETNATVANHTC